MTLNLKADSYVSVTRQGDPSDRWDRDDTNTDWSFGNILSTRDSYNDVQDDYLCTESLTQEDLEVGKRYWVYVVVWDTADSFGQDSNYYAGIVGIFEERKEESSFMSDHTFNYEPWDGYFECVSYVEEVRVEYVG